MQIVPASINFAPAVHRPDRYKVCSDACHHYQKTLKGCSHCPLAEPQERYYRRRPGKSTAPPARSNPQIPIPQSAVPMVFHPVPQSAFQFQIPQTTTGSTTPDWNKLCAQLCRNGTGGLLCNCNILPPF